MLSVCKYEIFCPQIFSLLCRKLCTHTNIQINTHTYTNCINRNGKLPRPPNAELLEEHVLTIYTGNSSVNKTTPTAAKHSSTCNMPHVKTEINTQKYALMVCMHLGKMCVRTCVRQIALPHWFHCCHLQQYWHATEVVASINFVANFWWWISFWFIFVLPILCLTLAGCMPQITAHECIQIYAHTVTLAACIRIWKC